eukprot:5200645-Amphidinium_carterae.1
MCNGFYVFFCPSQLVEANCALKALKREKSIPKRALLLIRLSSSSSLGMQVCCTEHPTTWFSLDSQGCQKKTRCFFDSEVFGPEVALKKPSRTTATDKARFRYLFYVDI